MFNNSYVIENNLAFASGGGVAYVGASRWVKGEKANKQDSDDEN
jgi:hypothetical protein